MLKLYKNVNGELHYWETWKNDENTSSIHWGVVGQKGEGKTVKSSFLMGHEKKIQKETERYVQDGYKEIELDDHATLLVEYEVDGMGTPDDVNKRHAIEDELQEILGWYGLGYCDGGSIGSGTMEACCYVVNFDIAKRVIEASLKGTEFSDYSKIFKE